MRKLVVAASLASAQVSRCLLIPVLKSVFLPSPINYKNKYMLTFHFKALCKGKNLACEELNSRKGSRSLKAGEKLKHDLKAWGYARRWLLCSSKKKLLRPLLSFSIWVLLSGSTLGSVLWSFVLNNQSKRALRQHRVLSCTSEAQMNEEHCISLRRFTICPSRGPPLKSSWHQTAMFGTNYT